MPDQPELIHVPIIGTDPEIAAIGGVVFLLENGHFDENTSDPLDDEQKARVVGYLMKRYGRGEP